MVRVISEISNEQYDKLLEHSNAFLAKHGFFKRDYNLYCKVPPFSFHRKPLNVQVIAPRDRNRILQPLYDRIVIRLGRDSFFEKVRELYANIPRSAVMKFLGYQEEYQLHLVQPREKMVSPVKVSKINARWQMDHIIMNRYARENEKITVVLVIIDTFSKYAWLCPAETKSGEQVAYDLEGVIKQNKEMTGGIPAVIQSDNSAEFKSDIVAGIMRKYGILHIRSPTYLPQAQGIVERFNKTLKSAIHLQFTRTYSEKYIDKLQEIAKEYNNTVHSTIKDMPIRIHRAGRKNIAQRKIMADNLDRWKKTTRHYAPLRIGDKVRLHILTEAENRKNKLFAKSYVPQWSEEVYTVRAIFGEQSAKVKPYYTLVDDEGDELKQRYYRHDLQKIKTPKLFV